jgi:hypothetical protein
MKKCVIDTHFTMKIICTYLYITCNKNILFVKIFLLLSEHKHCNNAATNLNSENARSRMVASYWGSMDMGTKEDESSTGHVWAAGFYRVMACSRLARILKTYEPFISLIFQIFGGPQ